MNKSEFMNYEETKVKEMLAENYDGEIKITKVAIVKMNDQKLNGLSVFLGENNICPTVYLDDAFRAYSEGENPDFIAKRVVDQITEASIKAPQIESEKKAPDLSDKPIALRLLEISRNKEFLQDVPYMSVGNGLALALIESIGLYFLLKPLIDIEAVSWIYMLAAVPFGILGFVKYNGMSAEKFIWGWIKSELLMPRKLYFGNDNLYWALLKEKESLVS